MSEALNTPPLPVTPSSPEAGTTEKKKTRKEKRPSFLFVNYYGVLFLGIVGIFLLAGFFVLRPQLETYKALQAQAAVKTTQLADQRAYLDSLNRSTAAAQQIPAETLADVEDALPPTPGIPELLTALSRIAQAHNVGLSNVQFGQPTDAPEKSEASAGGGTVVQSMSISLNLSSPSYAATRRYLDAIERNLRIFDVQTISVSPGQGETGQVYSVQLQTYVLPPAVRP